jgi:hypothetical protein
MLSQINIGGLLEPKNLFVSFGKTIYIMILLTYFLLGVVSGFLIELSIHKLTDYKVGYLERFFLITLWPIMVIVWIYNFIVTKKD